MKILELFAGTRSIGKAFEARGHEVYSVEWDKDFENIDLYTDIGQLTAEEVLRNFGHPDVIWASPDCTTFSVMAISYHRRKNPQTKSLDPITEYARFCDAVDQHVLALIQELKPAFWFIENPRGGMRKMEWMQGLPRYTVTLLSDLCLIVNEEGAINDCPFNMNLCGMQLFGTILAVGVAGDEFCDVPEEHLKDILY